MGWMEKMTGFMFDLWRRRGRSCERTVGDSECKGNLRMGSMGLSNFYPWFPLFTIQMVWRKECKIN